MTPFPHDLGDDPPAGPMTLAEAYRRFELDRQALNRSLAAWVALRPSGVEVADEVDGTCRAVRALARMGGL